METLGLFGILGYFTIEDIKSRRLKTAALMFCGLAGVILHIFLRRISAENMIGGMAVGAVMYLISVLSKGRIGKGDAVLIMVTGIFLGFWNNLMLLWAAVMFAGAAGWIAIFILKKEKNYEMPFVPFMLAAYILCLAVWGGRLI